MRQVEDEADILRYARELDSRKGEPDPELVQHTTGTREAATTTSGSIAYGEQPFWLIAMKGNFRARRALPPDPTPTAGNEFVSYTVQVVVVEIASGRATDFGGGHKYPDLAAGGRVITDYERPHSS
jgi:hypothetical protein